MKKGERDLQQIIREETTRGRDQPISAVTLERKRRIRAIVSKLADPRCDKRQFAATIREDFGLSDDSPEFLQCMKLWDEHRGH